MRPNLPNPPTLATLAGGLPGGALGHVRRGRGGRARGRAPPAPVHGTHRLPGPPRERRSGFLCWNNPPARSRSVASASRCASSRSARLGDARAVDRRARARARRAAPARLDERRRRRLADERVDGAQAAPHAISVRVQQVGAGERDGQWQSGARCVARWMLCRHTMVACVPTAHAAQRGRVGRVGRLLGAAALRVAHCARPHMESSSATCEATLCCRGPGGRRTRTRTRRTRATAAGGRPSAWPASARPAQARLDHERADGALGRHDGRQHVRPQLLAQ